MIKRFDRLDIATSDLADARSIYSRNFGFDLRSEADAATIAIGGAEIRLRSGDAVADLIASSGEGLAALWLETEDIEQAAAALTRAAVPFEPVRREGERRIIAVNPASANQVVLYIFDRTP
jgi:hypothetical protein